MYGCLGFSHSRFYAQPIAALITALGRDTLKKTRDIAEDDVKLEVIYGDTDSIMINTGITDLKDYAKVMELGQKVKREVNRRYKTLELEIDGVFKSMLLLKKKKYAAITIQQTPNGEFVFEKELKGLDLVRRDWCIQSKDTGRYVLDQILSVTGQEVDSVVGNIYTHLEELAQKMRAGELPLDKFTITKGLSKHPKDYPDGKSQPHVQVAKAMLKNKRPVNVGDHIPYIICLAEDETAGDVKPEPGTAPVPMPAKKKLSVAERARHPDEIMRSNGALKPDIEWYLTQQILPPITRLCEPIAAASQAEIAQKLGLDSSKYNQIKREPGDNPYDDDLIDYKPASSLSDKERFKDAEKLSLTCLACGDRNVFGGAVRLMEDGKLVESGLNCPTLSCHGRHLWGHKANSDLFAKVTNVMLLSMHRHVRAYYAGVLVCDDSGCQQETKQLSVLGDVCLKRGCTGKLKPKYSDFMLYTQLKYFDTLFDTNHALRQIIKSGQNKFVSRKEILKEASMSAATGGDVDIMNLLHDVTQAHLSLNAYNWVEPSIWQTLFGNSTAGKSVVKTQ
jgi:DNA polymerase alpha subunit A